MNTIETIRAHIDQQYDGNREKARYDDYYRGMNDGLDKLEQFLDTLQEPEVDLEKEMDSVLVNNYSKIVHGSSKEVTLLIAKHFYELGLKNAK